MSQRFSLVLRSMYGENAEIGSLSGATIGIIEFTGIVIGADSAGDGIAPPWRWPKPSPETASSSRAEIA